MKDSFEQFLLQNHEAVTSRFLHARAVSDGDGYPSSLASSMLMPLASDLASASATSGQIVSTNDGAVNERGT